MMFLLFYISFFTPTYFIVFSTTLANYYLPIELELAERHRRLFGVLAGFYIALLFIFSRDGLLAGKTQQEEFARKVTGLKRCHWTMIPMGLYIVVVSALDCLFDAQ